MSTLSDIQIRAWIKNNERFEQRGDGGGLFISYRKDFSTPIWRFRYRIAGNRKVMTLGSYANLSLSDARKKLKN